MFSPTAPISPICRTPLFPDLTFYSCFFQAQQLIDNPWAVAYERARKAGALLARVLLAREQGARPVVLVGFSLGALVIWECLHALATHIEEGQSEESAQQQGVPKRKGARRGPKVARAAAAGIVQHAVLMGLPAPSDPSRWRRLRGVVAGRLVNCYRQVFVFAHPPISPICRTPLFPYLTF